jgi:hypothetical protein
MISENNGLPEQPAAKGYSRRIELREVEMNNISVSDHLPSCGTKRGHNNALA